MLGIEPDRLELVANRPADAPEFMHLLRAAVLERGADNRDVDITVFVHLIPSSGAKQDNSGERNVCG